MEVYKSVYEVDQIRGDKKVPKQSSVIKKIRKYRLRPDIERWLGIRKFKLDDLYVRFFRLGNGELRKRRDMVSFPSFRTFIFG